MSTERDDQRPAATWSLLPPGVSPRPHQIHAVESVLRAVTEGRPRVRAILVQGSGVTAVVAECIARLVAHGHCRRALCIVDRRVIAEHLRHVLNGPAFSAIVLEDQNPPLTPQVQIATFAYFTVRSNQRLANTSSDQYDLVVVPYLRDHEALRRILGKLAPSHVIGFSTSEYTPVPPDFDPPTFIYDPKEEVFDGLASPPPGFRAVRLDAIAEIRRGVQRRRETDEGGIEVRVVRGADIARDWTWPSELLETLILSAETIDENVWVRPGDILIPRAWNFGTGHVGVIVPEDPPFAVPASSVIVVRVWEQELISPALVLDFLQSRLGRQAIAATSSMLRSSIRMENLGNVVVHVPVMAAGERESPPPDTTAQKVAVFLRAHVLPQLDALGHADSEETSLEHAQLAHSLRRLATELAPPSLAQRVLEAYPTPISLAWRRFHDARFNPFEQVLRLRDLFEAAAFFVYNLVLADVLRRLDPKVYTIPKDARGAWRGPSMAKRMDFVDAMLSNTSALVDLFVPELAASSVATLGKQLQDEFRNRISHSNAASESYQRGLVTEYQPHVEGMIDELRFLENYRLARIPTVTFRFGRAIQRIELWRGVVPELLEHQLDEDADLPRIDGDHLVLLNIDGDHLDLHPVYQLVDSTATGLQPHIFFVKGARPEDELLIIGSTHDATELRIPGYASLKQLEDEFRAAST